MSNVQSITSADGSKISVLLNTVERATAQVVFAHGAGANMSHEFMESFTLLLNEQGINVIRFNFPFMDKRALTAKKYPPDRMPKLLTCYYDVINHVISQTETNTLPLFIGGKSMGSRVAATLVSMPAIGDEFADSVVADIIESNMLNVIKGVFCLGYPFHPAKKSDKLRLEPIQLSTKPILILQGERDTLGDKTEIMTYNLPDYCQCVFLGDGDHSLKPRVKSGFTQQEHMQKSAKEISLFIRCHLT